MTTPHLDIQQHPITSDDYVAGCRERLNSDGALVLRGFAMPDTVRQTVTPTEESTTRLLVVFAYNDKPGIALSESALATFYGRNATS